MNKFDMEGTPITSPASEISHFPEKRHVTAQHIGPEKVPSQL